MPEQSRWQAGSYVAGHWPALATKQLRARAANGLGEINAEYAAATRLFRTQPEDFAQPSARRIHSLQEVTAGLGLDRADEARVWRAVDDANTAFETKGNQRLLHARGALIHFLRSQEAIAADVRQELVRRSEAFWKYRQSADGSREASVRYVVSKSLIKAGEERPGHKYTSRKPDGKGGWLYEYADEANPHAAAKAKLREAMAPLYDFNRKSHDKTPNHVHLKEALMALHAASKTPAEKKEAKALLNDHLKAARVHMTNMRNMEQKHRYNAPVDASRHVTTDHKVAAETVRDMLEATKTAISRKGESEKAKEGREKRSQSNAMKYVRSKGEEAMRKYRDANDNTMRGIYYRDAKRAADEHQERFGAPLPGFTSFEQEVAESRAEREKRQGGPDLAENTLSIVADSAIAKRALSALVRESRRRIAAGANEKAERLHFEQRKRDVLHQVYYRHKREQDSGQQKFEFDKSMRPMFAVRVQPKLMRLEY